MARYTSEGKYIDSINGDFDIVHDISKGMTRGDTMIFNKIFLTKFFSKLDQGVWMDLFGEGKTKLARRSRIFQTAKVLKMK